MPPVVQDSELPNGGGERRDGPEAVSPDADPTPGDPNPDDAVQSEGLRGSRSVCEVSGLELADPKLDESKESVDEPPEMHDSAAVNVIGSPELADHKLDDLADKEIQSNGAQDPPSTGGIVRPELQKDAGGRTFTMRQLLNELKDDQRNESSDGAVLQSSSEPANDIRDTSSPHSQDGIQKQQQYRDQNNAAMELINSVTGIDEEGRSRQRVLTFAAGRYASAIERNPDDYDALYNWALVLQESADNVDPSSSSPSKDSLLEEACVKYEEATRLCPTLHDAYYNWAIAISDRAKMRGRTKEAEELWKQATKNYERAVQLNWNSPQALNNWGLALQELSGIVPAREKQTIVRTAISKFRAAIQLQFDFHRAIYNLGTVLYGLAEDTLRIGGSSGVKEASPNALYSQSAIYIAAAHALKPNYSVYHSALKLVRSMLPLPYLKVGYLTAPPAKDPVAPHSDWKLSQFVLNHEGLQQLNGMEQRETAANLSGRSGDGVNGMSIKVDIWDIVCVSACADWTLPRGAGLCIDTIHGPVFLVGDSWETLDGWVDAIRLVYTIFARGKSDVLGGIIAG